MNRRYIQLQANWCWVAACEMVGEQYKKNVLSTNDSFEDIEVDTSQEAIVQNANTVMPGTVGNFPGDDEAKIRGLKYVVTGDCNSTLIEVANLGTYDMSESIFELYGKEIASVFGSNNYIIGNAVLFPDGICHSFVLMGVSENRIQVFDPWDGSTKEYCYEEVFEIGFTSARGAGIIKWIQYICGGDPAKT